MDNKVTDEAILKKMDEVGNQITHVQEVNDRLLKKYDGLDLENIKTNSELAAKSLESIQEMKTKMEAAEKQLDSMKDVVGLSAEQKERLDVLELAMAKGGGHDGQNPVEEKEYKSAILGYLRKGILFNDEMLQRITQKQAEYELIGATPEKIASHQKDLVTGSGPEGGYWLMPDRSARVITRIFETSPIRSYATINTTSADIVEFPYDDGEFDSGWVGEVEERPVTSTAQIAMIKIPIHEAYAMPRASQKMLDDNGFDTESWLNNKVSDKIGRKENTAFVLGDGSKTPRGFLTYPNWTTPGVYQRSAVEQIESTGTAGTLDNADDYITLQNELLEAYQGGAAFGMKRGTFSEAMKLKDENGQYLLDPRILKEGTDKILLGAPVIFMADIPQLAANALAVVYANWREFYTIIDRMGIRVLRDPYTAKPYILFYTTKRVGGGVLNFEAAKILKVNA